MFKHLHERNYFMIIGAAKCATTSLAYWLDQHHGWMLSNPKEPTYWECDYPRGEQWYLEKCFPDDWSGNNIIFEARVRHLCTPFVAERVLNDLGKDVPIIIVIRDPAERFISDWMHWRNMRPGREPLNLMPCIDHCIKEFNIWKFNSEESVCSRRDVMGGNYIRSYLEIGMYDFWINFWEHRFRNIMVLLYDDVIKDPQGTCNKISQMMTGEDFIKVNPVHLKKSNVNSIYPGEKQKALEILRDFYRQSVRNLNESFPEFDIYKRWKHYA